MFGPLLDSVMRQVETDFPETDQQIGRKEHGKDAIGQAQMAVQSVANGHAESGQGHDEEHRERQRRNSRVAALSIRIAIQCSVPVP